ncbi:ACP S-malonyltransferase [Allokutzneria sp. A3M-2-11 16]|uniref:ACP S-malonyltransferase n=1 Tax=Allokutzneria sp. A3M-2-11 16 TaxID=2962043 RepID=UPI0020B75FBA|nr:ACP S-malonyltransferase [Allokutzneria sp. A3M-2-11 16]MCP3803833.1 ACP S-malonyltransferase [Allokutzneria sp. A3M-2-11 16]
MTEQRVAIAFPMIGPTSFAEVGRFMAINPFARRRVALASAALGYPVLSAFQRTEDGYTEISQVAFVINSLAAADWAEAALGITPEICVGPSFGGRALAAYSGALPFEDVIRLTAELAREELDHFAAGPSAATTSVSQLIVRTPEEALNDVLGKMTERGEWQEISGYFDHDVHLVSMHENCLESFKKEIRAHGGYALTTFQPAVHSHVLEPLREHYRNTVYARFSIGAPRIPTISDLDGALIETADRMRSTLVDSVTRPVHWGRVTKTLLERGITTICVAGPDHLVHRLSSLRANFELIPAGPDEATRPVPSPRHRAGS